MALNPWDKVPTPMAGDSTETSRSANWEKEGRDMDTLDTKGSSEKSRGYLVSFFCIDSELVKYW